MEIIEGLKAKGYITEGKHEGLKGKEKKGRATNKDTVECIEKREERRKSIKKESVRK